MLEGSHLNGYIVILWPYPDTMTLFDASVTRWLIGRTVIPTQIHLTPGEVGLQLSGSTFPTFLHEFPLQKECSPGHTGMHAITVLQGMDIYDGHWPLASAVALYSLFDINTLGVQTSQCRILENRCLWSFLVLKLRCCLAWTGASMLQKNFHTTPLKSTVLHSTSLFLSSSLFPPSFVTQQNHESSSRRGKSTIFCFFNYDLSSCLNPGWLFTTSEYKMQSSLLLWIWYLMDILYLKNIQEHHNWFVLFWLKYFIFFF